MLHMHLPTDPRIVDEIFSLKTKNGMEDVGWLLAMVATYGKTPSELKGFTWNDDHSINIKSKKRSLRPLHPQWVFLFQLKEKQPFNLKSRWSTLNSSLEKTCGYGNVSLTIKGLLLAHKVRKVYYTPLKRSDDCQSSRKSMLTA